MTSAKLNEIRQKAFETLNAKINEKEYGMFCDLHDPKLYDATDEKAHNCIGCNLNEYSQILINSLESASEFQSAYELFVRFIVNAYILNERIRVYVKIIGMTDQDFNAQYPTLKSTMKWANFIKHPKAFMLVHEPGYVFESSIEHSEKIANPNLTVIDQAFIDKFYSGPANNAALYTILTNNKNVLVVLPDLVKLSKDFSDECALFIKSVLNTESYRQALKNSTTLANYFSESDEE